MPRISVILLTFATVSTAPAALAASAAAAPSAGGDFDGDGESDLAIGAPLDSVGGQANAGAVNVIYGSERRDIREDPDRQFTQNTSRIRGAAASPRATTSGPRAATASRASHSSYADAKRAVDRQTVARIPRHRITVVGRGLRWREAFTAGRLVKATTAGGAAPGAVLGVFLGVAAWRLMRRNPSVPELGHVDVGEYDVLAELREAERARELLDAGSQSSDRRALSRQPPPPGGRCLRHGTRVHAASPPWRSGRGPLAAWIFGRDRSGIRPTEPHASVDTLA